MRWLDGIDSMDMSLSKLWELVQPVHPKGDESWVFIGRIDTGAKTPVLWPPHVKS